MVNSENICNYNKAELGWKYGVPYIKNATKVPCKKNKFPKEGANYCEEHGCYACNYVNVTKIKSNFGKEVCSIECRIKSEDDHLKELNEEEEKEWRRELASVEQKEDNELKEKIRNIHPPFYEQINRFNLGKLKSDFIKREISAQELIDNVNLIIQNSSLGSAEKSQWKNIYSEGNFELELVYAKLAFNKERDFLISLSKQRKLREQQQQQEEEEYQIKKRIVEEIKQELSYCAPKVELKELPAVYHNYETLELQKLKRYKGDIIKEIKVERERKKLSNLLDKATICVDNELHNFIQRLEKFASNHVSQYEKAAYLLLKDRTDTVINSLQKRLNNLDEETRLSYCWDNACRSFDNWIREGENLTLSDNCPFRDFKESVKKIRNESEIKNYQDQAFQHIIEKFKKNIKEQISAEEWDNEFQEVDNSKDFFEVKLARENIQQGRKKSLEEFIEGAINNLQNLLDSNQEVNLSEIILPTWKEDLKGLKSKGEVGAFVKKMEKEIGYASHNKQEKLRKENRPNSSNWLLSHWKIVGIIVILGFIFTFLKLVKSFSNWLNSLAYSISSFLV